MKRLSFLLFILLLIAIKGQTQKTFRNPILSGFYPDPGICRVGSDYYIVNSSFAWFPGLPVFHSRKAFLIPVKWKDGWPHILEGNEEVKYEYPVPFPAVTKKVVNPYGGNAFYKDDFNEASLNSRAYEELGLKIEARNTDYFFYYSATGEKQWIYLAKEAMDARFLSTQTAGGFVGSVFGLYATSLGKESDSKAYFSNFSYKGDDDIYKHR